MGFWQHLVESYEKNADVLQKNYPLSTTTISNNSDNIVVIVINGEGEFQEYRVIPKRPTGKKRKEVSLQHFLIPVSEKSMGRSSGACPHPVFDQFGYLKGEGKKFELYISGLEDFAVSEFSTDQVRAIYVYIKKRSLESDLAAIKPKDKTNIVFEVEIEGLASPKVWKNTSFFEAWHQFYLSKKRQGFDKKTEARNRISESNVSKDEKKELRKLLSSDEQESVDYISGESNQLIAIAHPKKLFNGSANSKLVSDNDKTNYTFRGKFTSASEAISIGYEASQKAHQFLRYLINERGIVCGEQVIFSYTIGSIETEITPPIDEKSIWSLAKTITNYTEKDAEEELRAKTGFDYAGSIRKWLAGYGSSSVQQEHDKTAVIALDAATTGRLSITFYRELDRGDYLKRIADWHDQCKWQQRFWDKETEKNVSFIGAPSVDRIIEAVYGKPRGVKDEGYTKIKKAARESLLRCIFDGASIPHDYVRASNYRASNPLALVKKGRNGKQSRREFDTVLSTACALTRRDFQQRNQENYEMSIDLERTDRDYLYGRLLGAADNLEEFVLHKDKKSRIVTAALRYMQAFSQRPFSTWNTIHGCLNPYIQKEKHSIGFIEIQSIMAKFEEGDFEKPDPLGGAYLLGYYHERAHIESLAKEISEKNKNKGE